MAIEIPTLGAQASGLALCHALLLACVHRAAHFRSPYYVDGTAYFERNRLIWLYDIRLLSAALDSSAWSFFVERAHSGGVSALCRDALLAAADLVAAEVPSSVLDALSRPEHTEVSAQLLADGRWRGTWVDLRAQGSIAGQIKFLRELFFPGAEYMHRKYPGRRNWQLPYLYLRRVVEGVRKRMK